MFVHDYSDSMMISLNAVLGSYECQYYRAKHYSVHIVQVFRKKNKKQDFHRVGHILSLHPGQIRSLTESAPVGFVTVE